MINRAPLQLKKNLKIIIKHQLLKPAVVLCYCKQFIAWLEEGALSARLYWIMRETATKKEMMWEGLLSFRPEMKATQSLMMASRSHWQELLVSSNWVLISFNRICENRWYGLGYIWNWATSKEWSYVFATISRTWVHWGFPRNHPARL